MVSTKSAKKEAVTDINGKFELSIPENETQLKVSCVGFATTYVNLTDDSSLAITLKEDICKADELIPIAQMRKETRQSITGSLSMENAGQNSRHSYQGRMPTFA